MVNTQRDKRAWMAATLTLGVLASAACQSEGGRPKPSTTQAKPSSNAPTLPTVMATPGYSATPVPDPKAADTPPSQIFNAGTNVFKVDVSTAPTHPNSAAMVQNLRNQITPHWGGIAAFNNDRYNPSYYVVDSKTPRVDLEFFNCQNKPGVPEGLMDGPAMFKQVPIPAGAIPAAGTDSTLTLYDPTTDQLWEFWVLRKQAKNPNKWEACWGGRIDNVSKSPGFFDSPYGASASGLVTTGSMVTLKEAASGKIEHAMALNLIETGHHSRIWYPANRSDGNSSNPNAIPEGARLRLDPSVNVDALQMTPLAKAIAKAAQKHGFIVVDTAHAVAVIAESGQAQQAKTGKDPWGPILGGVPNYKQLEGFPWDKVQVIQQEYGKPGS